MTGVQTCALPILSVTITGIPSDVTLSDSGGPLTVSNGSVTLTAAQLAGLTLQAGEASSTLTVTATENSLTTSQTIAVTVNGPNRVSVDLTQR